MELKKSSIPTNTVTRKLTDLDAPTGNIYESSHAAPTRSPAK